MKSVLLSVRPQHVVNILNKIKTLEIRKRFPKGYVGWVYIYCTKEQGLARLYNGRWNDTFVCEKDITDNEFKRMYSGYDGKGKVVARFWCDKVEEIIFGTTLYNDLGFFTCDLHDFDLYKQSCLTKKEMQNYLKVKPNGLSGYAIHITNLVIFDKPKEIGEFKRDSGRIGLHATPHGNTLFHIFEPLTRAPQSWQFIEV